MAWTSRGTKGIAAFHKMASTSDRFRLNATASFLDQENHFFGIGEAAGDAGDALTLQDKQLNLKATATFRVFANGFAGVRYQLGTHDARKHVLRPSAARTPCNDEAPARQSDDDRARAVGRRKVRVEDDELFVRLRHEHTARARTRRDEVRARASIAHTDEQELTRSVYADRTLVNERPRRVRSVIDND